MGSVDMVVGRPRTRRFGQCEAGQSCRQNSSDYEMRTDSYSIEMSAETNLEDYHAKKRQRGQNIFTRDRRN
jgi:hypothetical protein